MEKDTHFLKFYNNLIVLLLSDDATLEEEKSYKLLCDCSKMKKLVIRRQFLVNK